MVFRAPDDASHIILLHLALKEQERLGA